MIGDTRQESNLSIPDQRDSRHESKDIRRDSRDYKKQDSRDNRRNSKDYYRQDFRDPKSSIRNARHESMDARLDSKSTKSESPNSICEVKKAILDSADPSNESRTPRPDRTDPSQESSAEKGILVRENVRTVKVDNTMIRRGSRVHRLRQKRNSDGIKSFKESEPEVEYTTKNSPVSCFSRANLHCEENTNESDLSRDNKVVSKANGEPSQSKMGFTEGTRCFTNDSVTSGSEIQQPRSGSPTSVCSGLSECRSTFSTSDITFSMQYGLSRENSLRRPKSAPINIVRNGSSGSLPNMIVNNFKASSSDNFRSHGAWRFFAEYRGRWESKKYSSYPTLTMHYNITFSKRSVSTI